MAASKISKKRPVIFNTIAGCKTPWYILLRSFIKLFMRIITIFSPHFLSLPQCSFLQGLKRKCSSISVERSMLILLYVTGTYFSRPRKGIFNTHKVSAVLKIVFIMFQSRKFWRQYSALSKVSVIRHYIGFQVSVWFFMTESFH